MQPISCCVLSLISRLGKYFGRSRKNCIFVLLSFCLFVFYRSYCFLTVIKVFCRFPGLRHFWTDVEKSPLRAERRRREKCLTLPKFTFVLLARAKLIKIVNFSRNVKRMERPKQHSIPTVGGDTSCFLS